MTKAEAMRCVALLRAAFHKSSSTFTQDQAKYFASQILDLEFNEVGTAVRDLSRTEEWMPSLAEVRRYIAEARHQDLKSPEAACEEILFGVRRHGFEGYTSIEWSSPELARAVRSIGWRKLCDDTRGSAIENVLRAYRRFREERIKQEMIARTDRQLEEKNG